MNSSDPIQSTIRYLKELQAEGETELPIHLKPKPEKKSAETLDAYQAEISGCLKCPLGKSRTKFVFGVGNPKARLMFVGEGPGFQEDRKGEPFVGPAGQLLDKILVAMKLSRKDVYIANMVKCHPMIEPDQPDKRGNDRPPTQEEMATCYPYLQKQISLIRPKLLCALGSTAAKALLGTETPISKLRGKLIEFSLSLYPDIPPIPLMPTYHPAALLRNPVLKKDVWEDMKVLLKMLEQSSS